MPTRPVSMQNLVVVDFTGDENTPEMKHWKNLKLSSQVLCAEKCSRKIWFGAAEDFTTFPDIFDEPGNEMLVGKEAYSRLLHYTLGVRNEGEYDPAAYNRYMDGRTKLVRRNEQAGYFLLPIMNALDADLGVVKSAIGREPTSTRTWLIARDLAGQKPGDHAIIIGNLDRSSVGPSFLTARMAMTLNAGGHKQQVGLLDMVHPDGKPESAEQLSTGVSKVFAGKDITIDVNALDAGDLDFAFSSADQVYITIDMDEYPELDTAIIQAWENRARTDNRLVHVKASPESEARWAEADPQGYISPSDIAREMQSRETRNADIYDRIRYAADTCANMRASHDEPKSFKVARLCHD